MNLRRILPIAASSTIFGLIGFFIGATQPKPLYRHGLDWQLSDAAMSGDLQKLRELHARGADLDAIPVDYFSGTSGYPPIMVAAIYNHPNAVGWLLENGANANAAMGPTTALSIAEGNLAEAQRDLALLKSHGAKHWDEE